MFVVYFEVNSDSKQLEALNNCSYLEVPVKLEGKGVLKIKGQWNTEALQQLELKLKADHMKQLTDIDEWVHLVVKAGWTSNWFCNQHPGVHFAEMIQN